VSVAVGYFQLWAYMQAMFWPILHDAQVLYIACHPSCTCNHDQMGWGRTVQ
jgi:hypothetical protein